MISIACSSNLGSKGRQCHHPPNRRPAKRKRFLEGIFFWGGGERGTHQHRVHTIHSSVHFLSQDYMRTCQSYHKACHAVTQRRNPSLPDPTVPCRCRAAAAVAAVGHIDLGGQPQARPYNAVSTAIMIQRVYI